MRSTSRDWQCRHFAGIPPAEASGGTGAWQVHGLARHGRPSRRRNHPAARSVGECSKQQQVHTVAAAAAAAALATAISPRFRSGQSMEGAPGHQVGPDGERDLAWSWGMGAWFLGAPGTTHHKEKQANQDQRDQRKSGQPVCLDSRRPLGGPADGQRADGRAVLSHRKSDLKVQR